ncbi:MAG: fused response regulator/phosphatase [Firmicutes bacterium]|nr:fused response regulator/phosphatase [Bacillota bacterium]
MNKVLVVDRTAVSADLIRQCLSGADCQIFTAESGVNALAKVTLFSPDLVIIDADLPDVSGYDVCKRIKRNPETQYILVLAVCAVETRESRLKAVEAGADDYIEKSFETHVLISKVNSLLRVKRLSDQLKQKYIEIEEKNRVIEFQLKMGRQVQRSLIPDVDMDFRGIRFLSHYMPALYIGGDFYDVVKLNETSMGVVIGDVSGHGISAALLTAMLHLMIRNITAVYYNPDQFLYILNNEMCKIFESSGSEVYATVFAAVIDTKERKVYYSNAGHVYPAYLDAESLTVSELAASGVPVGLMRDSRYEFKTRSYHENDMIVFYTDGLVDVFYKETPEEFMKKIGDILIDVHTVGDMNEVMEMLLNSFYDYNASDTAKYEMDDVSLVICRM